MLLLRRRKEQNEHCSQPSCPRSVVTFYHDMSGESSSVEFYSNGDSHNRLRQEIDLQDFEALVETYKSLVTNHRKNLQRRKRRLRRLRSGPESAPVHRSDDSKREPDDSSPMVVTEVHKKAIVTLVRVDATSKRVIGIRPEFFPRSTRVVPSCLGRLDSLKCLRLDRCTHLARVPSALGLGLSRLTELRLDVSAMNQPLPTSFGELGNLTTLVLFGSCARLDAGNVGENNSSMVLFPSSMAKLKLKHLETHIQNLLHISPEVLDGWSASMERLVVTQDLVMPSVTATSSDERSMADGSASSVSEDYLFLDSEDDNEDEDEGNSFSILQHSNIFREALKLQLEERTFRSIARFRNLRALKLLFDDSEYREEGFVSSKPPGVYHCTGRSCKLATDTDTQCVAPPSRTPYTVPLSWLAGPLSSSLKELDIGSCIASTTSSASPQKSVIPIEISWIDILREFPLLERLRLQDCRCSFAKTSDADANTKNTIEETDAPLLLNHLKQLVLDRCPEFALADEGDGVTEMTSSSSSFQEANSEYYLTDHNGSLEEIVFSPSGSSDEESATEPENERNQDIAISFDPVDVNDIEALVNENPKEIFCITRPTSLQANTVFSPTEREDSLAILCRKMLPRCPSLELLCLRDCGITGFCSDLLSCLPTESLRELTLDAHDNHEKKDKETIRTNLWALIDAYPSLMYLNGSYTKLLETEAEQEQLQRRLVQRQHRYRASRHLPGPLKRFFSERINDMQKHGVSHNIVSMDDSAEAPGTAEEKERATAASTTSASLEGDHQNPVLRLPLVALNRIRKNTGMLQKSIRRSNSREFL